MMIAETVIRLLTTDAQVVTQISKSIIKLAILQLLRRTNSMPWTLRSLQKGADTWIEPHTLRRFDFSPSTTQAFSTESTSALIMYQSVHEKFRPDSVWWDYAILAA